jgi:beta-lactamase regulating signal transducer with metallopeptidase domain
MVPAVNEVMLVIGSSLAASIVIKVTVTVALGFVAVWLGRGNRAAVRHALLAAIFGVILLLPIASVVMPPLHVGVPVGVESRAALPFLVSVRDAEPSATSVDASHRNPLVAPRASKLSFSNLLLAGWAAGAALFLFPVVTGLWQIRSLRRSGLPWRRGQSVVETLALEAGIHRRVEVLLHEALRGPMTCGVVHPVIVLPWDAENWNQEDLNRAIVHELEHVRRRDPVSGCLARVASAVYWFHPMVWIARRRLVLEAERSCDDAVLRYSEGTAYADQLVVLAKRLSAAQRLPFLAMANRADLATRVRAVLDSRQQRGRAGTF